MQKNLVGSINCCILATSNKGEHNTPPTDDQNFTAMNTDQLTTYTRLMKNLWRIYAAAPAARKSAIYADIERTAAAMGEDLYTAVIDNLMTL